MNKKNTKDRNMIAPRDGGEKFVIDTRRAQPGAGTSERVQSGYD